MKRRNFFCFQKIYFISSVFLSVNFLSLFVAHISQAYEIERYPDAVENRFLVSPSKLDLQVSPGQEIKEKVQVVNRLGRRQEFDIIVEDLIDKAGIKEDNSAKNWIRPEINHFSLEQGERINFTFSMIVPDKIPAGGYYATLLVEAKNSPSRGKNVKVASRIGISLLTSVPGEINELGIVSYFRADRWFFWRGPAGFLFNFQNQGNVHLNPKGEIAVYNFLGSKVAQMPIAEALILPGKEKEWKTTWQKKWLLGYYTAVLSLRYGKDSTLVSKRTNFLAFPVDLLVLLIVILWLLHRILNKLEIQIRIKTKSRKNDKKQVETKN